jgi:hypothetical protein
MRTIAKGRVLWADGTLRKEVEIPVEVPDEVTFNEGGGTFHPHHIVHVVFNPAGWDLKIDIPLKEMP